MPDRRPTSVEGTAVLPAGEPEVARIEITDGMITAVGPATGRADLVLDDGRLLAPGLVDLQVNGGFGFDVTGHPSSIPDLARRLPELGTTAFLPTVVTADRRAAEAADAVVRDLVTGPQEGGAAVLGLHLEGPLIAPGATGAHDPDAVIADAAELLDRLASLATVRMVTYAPERDPDGRVAGRLGEQGIVAAVGHSQATAAEAHAAVAAGARHVTHLFNAMGGFHHRAPGLLGVALTESALTASVIADGVHLAPEALRLAWACLGPDRLALVSDSVAALGTDRTAAPLGVRSVAVADGRARTADGRLAGSTTPLSRGVRHLVQSTSATPAEAIRSASAVPARIIGDTRRGALAPGRRADLVVLDADLRVERTFVGGEVAFRH